jgi:ribosomal protein L3
VATLVTTVVLGLKLVTKTRDQLVTEAALVRQRAFEMVVKKKMMEHLHALLMKPTLVMTVASATTHVEETQVLSISLKTWILVEVARANQRVKTIKVTLGKGVALEILLVLKTSATSGMEAVKKMKLVPLMA